MMHFRCRQEEVVIQPEPVLQPETLDPDFIINLIRALVPGMTTEEGQGREEQSPRRRNSLEANFLQGRRGRVEQSSQVERLRDIVQQDKEVRRSEERLTNAVKMILQSAG